MCPLFPDDGARYPRTFNTPTGIYPAFTPHHTTLRFHTHADVTAFPYCCARYYVWSVCPYTTPPHLHTAWMGQNPYQCLRFYKIPRVLGSRVTFLPIAAATTRLLLLFTPLHLFPVGLLTEPLCRFTFDYAFWIAVGTPLIPLVAWFTGLRFTPPPPPVGGRCPKFPDYPTVVTPGSYRLRVPTPHYLDALPYYHTTIPGGWPLPPLGHWTFRAYPPPQFPTLAVPTPRVPPL